jgi:hypothetical protein
MYALRASVAKNLINPKNFTFGDTYAVVKDGDEFLRRVRTAAQCAGLMLEIKMVEYVDPREHQGPMGVFRKSSAFAYQSEFRIALMPGTGVPFPFRVGDLSDITVTGPLTGINSSIKVD